MIQHGDVVPGGSARADMAEHLRIVGGEVLRADGGNGARSHPRGGGAVDDRVGRAGLRAEQDHGRELRRHVVLVVLLEVADDLDARGADRFHVALEDVEQLLGEVEDEVILGRHDHLLVAVGLETDLDGVEHVLKAQLEGIDILAREKQHLDSCHAEASLYV